MRVLVVEDEQKLAEYLRKGLSEHGFVVDVARNGIDGRHLALEGEYELLILDVMLPGIDGFAVLAAVRKRHGMPVLMLTARDRVEDRVRGLQEGADDYLVKPFAFSELLARVRALLRRSGQASLEPNILHLADLELDLLRRKAWRGGERLALTFDSDTNVVEVAIRRLRAKLDDPFPTKLLHTVRGMGYVLEERI
jgi:two-component system copper resistance phosphate regulon response regulator CusR